MLAPMKYKILVNTSLALIAVYYTVIFLAFKDPVLHGASDFSSFYAAGSIVRSGQAEHLYDYAVQKQAQERFLADLTFRGGPLLYVHAPFELLLFLPLACLPYPAAFGLWFGCNLIFLLTVPFLARASLPGIRDRVPAILLVFGFFFPATLALIQGQDSIVLLLLFTLFYAAMKRSDDRAAGLCLALAAFKPQLLLVVLLAMVWQRQWKILAWFLKGSAILLLVSVAIVGWKATLGFPQFLLAFDRLPPEISGAYPQHMPNLRGALFAVLGSRLSADALRLTTVGATIGILAILLSKMRKIPRETDNGLQLALIMALTPLLAYHANTHDFVLYLLPFVLILDYLQTRRHLKPNHWVLGGSVAAVFLIPFVFPGPMPLFCGIAALTASLYYEVAWSRISSLPAAGESPSRARAARQTMDTPKG